jgi:uncharacterized membrane protein
MSARLRFDSIDALRGCAIVWMTAYHLGFDLNHFGYIRQDFYRDPTWTAQRTAIVSLFLFCAGLSQAVAMHQQQSAARFWKRWAQIAGCAVLVTAGSVWMYPKSFIFFGVLHAVAVMLLVVRATAGWGRWLWPAGLFVIAMHLIAGDAHAYWPQLKILDEKWLSWIGLVSRKPVTEDYVPLIPWLALMWWGTATGQWILVNHPAWLQKPIPALLSPVTWLGRWSLSWYMLHQPVIIGAITILSALRK